VTTHPALASYAKYPAVHWFSFYSLRDYLKPLGFECLDRFDLIDPTGKATLAQTVIRAVRAVPLLRFLGQVATPSTYLVAVKGSAHASWLNLVKGTGLDFYQVHWYDRLDPRLPLTTPVSEFDLDRPIVLGELPTRGSAWRVDDVIETARRMGYAGAWVWSLRADDDASDRARALAALRLTRGGAGTPT